MGKRLAAQNQQLSLDSAIHQALTQNRNILIQDLETERSKQIIRESKSYLLPAVSINGSYYRYFDKPVVFMPGSVVGEQGEPVVDIAVGGKNAFNSFVAVSQPLISESVRHKVKSSILQHEASEVNGLELKNEIAKSVSSLYLSILVLQEQLKLERQSLTRNKKALEDSKALLRTGRALKTDTLANHIAVQNIIPNISFLQSRIATTKDKLGILVGLKGGLEIELTDSLTANIGSFAMSVSLEEAFHTALTFRPDVKKQMLVIKISHHEKAALKAEKLPSIFAVGQYQIQAQADNKKLSDYNFPRTSFLGLQASWNVFSGLKNDSRTKQGKLKYQQEELRLDELKENVKVEISTQQAEYKNAVEKWKINQKNVKAAQENYNIINDRYRQGLASRLELTDAELALSQSKINKLQSLYQVNMARIDLRVAMGRYIE